MPWLANLCNPFIETLGDSDLEEVTVDALMKPGFVEWDEVIIRDMFGQRDQEEILAIPLSRTTKEDSWCWAWDSKGVYNVKSRYNFLCLSTLQVMAPTVTDWKKIWALKVPPKVRSFLWRAIDGCLPTKINLAARHVPVEQVCPLCGLEDETTLHALIQCPIQQEVWRKSFPAAVNSLAATMAQWWNWLSSAHSTHVLERCACILWSIWGNRNAAVWQGNSRPAAYVVNQASTMQEEWQLVQCSALAASVFPIQQVTKWIKPPAHTLKCNVDSAIFSDLHKMGYGGVVRDSQGQFVAAIRGTKPGSYTPIIAEAIGVREVLSWLKEAGFSSIIVETDSQILFNAINNVGSFLSSVGVLIDDCKAIYKAIDRCCVSFVRRSANRVAHSIARVSCSMSGWKVFGHVCPLFLSDVIADDLVE